MKIFVHDKEEWLIGRFFKKKLFIFLCKYMINLDYDFANRNVRFILYFDRLVMKIRNREKLLKPNL